MVNILSDDGGLLNTYFRDPFGEILSAKEKTETIFTFVGQWGVVDISEMPKIFYMKTRLYDSQTGRFMSMDTFGLKAHSKNFYVYCLNNPVHFNDPKGTCPMCYIVLGSAAVGAVDNLIDYVTNTPVQDLSWGGTVFYVFLFKRNTLSEVKVHKRISWDLFRRMVNLTDR